jgi:hypothetical protein
MQGLEIPDVPACVTNSARVVAFDDDPTGAASNGEVQSNQGRASNLR